MQLFYVPEIKGDNITLDETESRHSIKVLRLKEDSRIQIVDGQGGIYEAVIVNANPKKCQLQILKSTQEFGKRNFNLHIAIAPTKNIDRFEWFLEKATEIGIDEITPIICDRSERKTLKNSRLEKILVAAMKQSIKSYLPKLNTISYINDFITSNKSQHKYIAHCVEGNKPHLQEVVKRGENTLIMIGPEGDFSLEEINLAKSCGYAEISLGKSRLRTETAGIVSCHIVNLVNE